MSEENSIQDNEDVNTGAATPDLEETGDMMAATEVTGSPVRTAAPAEGIAGNLWQPEKDHGSATRMLTTADADVDATDGEGHGGSMINAVLIFLMILVCSGAFVTLQHTDGFYSEKGAGLNGIIDLKEAVARHQEQEFTYEELKKQKRFGSLTISSTPKGAMICTDKATLSRINLDEASKAALKKCPNPNERGETLFQLTTAPGKINGVDTAHMLPLVAQREGYQDFPLYIGTHLWPVNQGNEAQYVRVFTMIAKECNRWQTNDSQLGTLSFYSYMHCEQYTKGVKRKKNAARTTDSCVCNPEVIEPPSKKKKKKSKK
jgi:hypothetical protein